MICQQPDMTCRALMAPGAAIIIGSGFVAGASADWAMELFHLDPETMASLIVLARDIHPHEAVPDEFLAIALKGYDTPEAKRIVEAGIAMLDDAAQARGFQRYLDMSGRSDRAEMLRGMHDCRFLRTVCDRLEQGVDALAADAPAG